MAIMCPDAVICAGYKWRLEYNNIYVSVRGRNVRIAPHIYNNTADMNVLLEVLSEYKVAA